jgi:hypothetical protein
VQASYTGAGFARIAPYQKPGTATIGVATSPQCIVLCGQRRVLARVPPNADGTGVQRGVTTHCRHPLPPKAVGRDRQSGLSGAKSRVRGQVGIVRAGPQDLIGQDV